jgi:hypothetical protein
MAIYRLQIEPILRSEGHSSVGAAAYRAGERIRDDRTNEVHNHSRRKDVTHSEIMLPSELSGNENMEWARNRSSLWNSVENAESRKNARVAREIQVNLPHELPPERRVALARAFSQEVADHYKVAVDLAVHEPRPSGDPRNYHAHLLMTTRQVSAEGLGAKAALELSTHERMRLGLPSGAQEFTAIRERWATITNEALKEANIEARVDHRSLAEQGIDREPRPHIPFAAYKIERAGQRSDVAESIRADYAAKVQARLERQAAREPQATREAQAAREPQATREGQAAREPQAARESQATREPQATREAPAAREPQATREGQATREPQATREAQAAREPNAPAPQQPAPAPQYSSAPALQAPDAPVSQPTPALKSLEDIRREARENWLKMRAQQADQPAPDRDPSALSRGQPTPSRDRAVPGRDQPAPSHSPGAAAEHQPAARQPSAAPPTPTRALDHDQTL